MRQALANPAAFAETMRSRGMASAKLPGGTQVEGLPVVSVPADPMDRIARLVDLRDRGALTEDEFQAQKKRILGE